MYIFSLVYVRQQFLILTAFYCTVIQKKTKEKAEVEKKLLSYDIPYQGEGKSREHACVGDGIVVSPLALDFVRESERNEKLVLR